MAEKSQESEIGILKSIRFQNDKGFLIGIFENQHKKSRFGGNNFSGLGNIINPEPGIAYKLFGNWESNGQYGDQFKFNFYEVLQPTDTKGIYQYLVRVCKWVGPTVAGRIVDKFGTETLTVLKADPAKVSSAIAGITLDRAKEIQEKLKENEHIEKVMVELERIFAPIPGLRKNLSAEMISIWKSDALERLKKNPYILTRIKGTGFPTADKVALSMGFDRGSVFRESAAVWHLLHENMNAGGSVWMDEAKLKAGVMELTGLGGGLGKIAETGDEIVIRAGAWAVAEADRNETYIAEKVARMITGGSENHE
jgi:exodeoxyribonuclease V alpha subunit